MMFVGKTTKYSYIEMALDVKSTGGKDFIRFSRVVEHSDVGPGKGLKTTITYGNKLTE